MKDIIEKSWILSARWRKFLPLFQAFLARDANVFFLNWHNNLSYSFWIPGRYQPILVSSVGSFLCLHLSVFCCVYMSVSLFIDMWKYVHTCVWVYKKIVWEHKVFWTWSWACSCLTTFDCQIFILFTLFCLFLMLLHHWFYISENYFSIYYLPIFPATTYLPTI